jgi:type IV secretory pathway VirB6-like protein
MTKLWRILCCLLMLAFISVDAAWAQQPMPEPPDTCTDGPQFKFRPSGQPGIVNTVYIQVQVLTNSLSQTLFTTIQGDSDFQSAVAATLTLYVALYGAFFALGMARVNAYDFIMRLIKIAILGILVSPNAWNDFRAYVIPLFNNGVDDMITEVSSLAIGMAGTQASGYFGNVSPNPMVIIDRVTNTVISANMGVHLLAMLFTPPYGFIYLILICISLWAFLGMLLTAIWVYLVAFVMRGLLFGVAPIFIACLLFDRTRHLFIGWINQLFNTCLQPIMLLTFFVFFVLMAEKFIDQIIAVPVCWTEASEALEGTPFSVHFWRFSIPKSNPGPGETPFEPYGGRWDWTGPIDAPSSSAPFPIPLMVVLMFLAICELGKRFTQVVLMIARDLSASGVDLSGMQNALSGLMPTQSGAAAGQNAAASNSMRQTIAGGDIVGSIKQGIASLTGKRTNSGS